jgi:hypothetical protein
MVLVADPDRARVVGFVIHLEFVQLFAAFYAAGFATLDRAGWWLGALLGFVHAVAALTVLLTPAARRPLADGE